MKISTHLFNKVATCATLLFALSSCSGGGSGGGSTTAPPAPATGSATVTGTVSGTVIKVLRADTKALISQFDTTPLPGPPPFPFALSNIPVGLPIQILFFSAGQTFPLYGGNPPTNVFTMQTAGSIDLGAVTMSSGRATSQNPLINVILGVEDLLLSLLGNAPPPATLTVSTPAPATGSVIVDFAVQNFVIGGQGQQHLHIRVAGETPLHFFNGQDNKVVDSSGQPTSDVQWQSPTSFRLNRLGTYQVSITLATASDNEFVNPEANPDPVIITITLPVPLPTLTITSPSQGASLPSGDVDVSFTVQNFTIGGRGADHLHIYLDGGTANHFYSGILPGVVLDGNGLPVANITWQSTSSFRISGLSNSPHVIRLALSNPVHQDLPNADANPPDLNINIQAPPAPPTLTITSPAQGATLSAGPVPASFTIQNSPVPLSATQPRMHFYVDNDPVVYKFYDGPGITEDGNTSGVRYQGVHTHFVHWKSGGSIQLNALASGSHEVRFVLVDQSGTELPGTGKTLAFSIAAETGGAFSLQEVVGGMSFITAMATAPDGRIFVTEQVTGRIRVVTPTTTLPWELQSASFATLPIVTGNEKGLLGIAVHPNFSQNGFVYVFYTASGPVNRVVRFTATTSGGNTVATSATPEIIFDNIPAANDHNGGVIQFGPDGMLYIFVGDNEIDPNEAQNMSSLKGKILRIIPDGTIPSDNPFASTASAPFSAIYSLGHRNGFGFTFHPHTNDLWETENGESTDDQLNRIIAGGNYGWPLCTGICGDPRWIDPIITFNPCCIAPTGIVAIREDSAYPAQYHNNLLFADFRGQLHRIVLGGAGLTDLSSHTIACNCGQGGAVAVMHGLNLPGQDGYIYVSTTSNRIYRVVLNSP